MRKMFAVGFCLGDRSLDLLIDGDIDCVTGTAQDGTSLLGLRSTHSYRIA